MLRSILSVFIGYVVMAVAVMASTFGVAALFPEFASADADAPPPHGAVAWLLVLALPCGMLGGGACGWIAQRQRLHQAVVLALITFALGLTMAFFGRQPSQPVWYVFLLPVAGAAGVLLGGWLLERLK